MFSRVTKHKKWAKKNSCLREAMRDLCLDYAGFYNRLRQERLRSERSHLPLSLVVIEVGPLLDLIVENNGLSQEHAIQRVVDVLNTMTRDYDVKGWYQDEKIGVLTPDTDERGARSLVNKLVEGMTVYKGVKEGHHLGEIMHFFTILKLQGQRSYFTNSDRPTTLSGQCEDCNTISDTPYSPDRPPVKYRTGDGELAVKDWPLLIENPNSEKIHEFQLWLKRIIDIAGALMCLVLVAPLMFIIAVLIKLTSPGPVLFKQVRIGLLGKPFRLLKFRTMRVDCDQSVHKEYVKKLITEANESENPNSAESRIFKLLNDVRITSFGRFLRRFSLDELPQLFNVLIGDMSLVGPRPHPEYECEHYKRWYCQRLADTKPGITGLWQVEGRGTTNYDEMIRLDLRYIRSWSIWLDLKIILKTFRIMISGKGGF
jgi:lipopolysaccharide/colanic/teichoic acid biosynthesis glycosyltransferase